MTKHVLAAHDPPLRVDNESVRARLRIGKAPDGAMRRHRDLATRPISERHRIVPRLGDLGLLEERDLLAFFGRLAGDRQEQQVAQVRAACAAQVRLREAVERAVRIPVSAAVVPVEVPGVRTRLHEPERIRRSRSSVPVGGRPDARIDPRRKIPLCATECKRGKRRNYNNDPSRHNVLLLTLQELSVHRRWMPRPCRRASRTGWRRSFR